MKTSKKIILFLMIFICNLFMYILLFKDFYIYQYNYRGLTHKDNYSLLTNSEMLNYSNKLSNLELANELRKNKIGTCYLVESNGGIELRYGFIGENPISIKNNFFKKKLGYNFKDEIRLLDFRDYDELQNNTEKIFNSDSIYLKLISEGIRQNINKGYCNFNYIESNSEEDISYRIRSHNTNFNSVNNLIDDNSSDSPEYFDKFLKMSKYELLDYMGTKKIGSCYLEYDNKNLTFYFKTGVIGVDGDYGWPKDKDGLGDGRFVPNGEELSNRVYFLLNDAIKAGACNKSSNINNVDINIHPYFTEISMMNKIISTRNANYNSNSTSNIFIDYINHLDTMSEDNFTFNGANKEKFYFLVKTFDLLSNSLSYADDSYMQHALNIRNKISKIFLTSLGIDYSNLENAKINGNIKRQELYYYVSPGTQLFINSSGIIK